MKLGLAPFAVMYNPKISLTPHNRDLLLTHTDAQRGSTVAWHYPLTQGPKSTEALPSCGFSINTGFLITEAAQVKQGELTPALCFHSHQKAGKQTGMCAGAQGYLLSNKCHYHTSQLGYKYCAQPQI